MASEKSVDLKTKESWALFKSLIALLLIGLCMWGGQWQYQRGVDRHERNSIVKERKVFEITTAPAALTRDQAGRQKRYFISMMIRTACFILAVVLPSPYRWFALLGAVTLPYFAVVIANAGRETISTREDVIKDKPLALD